MPVPKLNSPEVLSVEILAEAGRECDEIIRRARNESASLLAGAKAEAGKIRHERREAAQTEAARRTEMTLATIPVKTGRLRSERIESILESVREDVRRRLLTPTFGCLETAVTLAVEAIQQMPGSDFVLKISPVNHAAFGDKLADEITQRAGRLSLKLEVISDPTITDCGVIVQDAEGKRAWDNRLLSRLERFWPELRRQMAGCVSGDSGKGGTHDCRK